MNNMNIKKGFTLIELMVVISIIGLMSSIVLSALNDARAKARDAQRIQSLKEIQKALILYYDANGQYPDDLSGSVYGTDCWECVAIGIYGVVYDSNKQAGLQQYLSTRPSDPSVPASGQFQVNTATARGYYYKVSGSGQDYKIGIIGTIENINNIPEFMRDTNFHWLLGVTITNTSSLSSQAASSWSIGDDVSAL